MKPKKMTRKQKPWDEALEKHTQFTEQQVRVCAKELFVLLTDAQAGSLQAVKKKFSHAKYGEVSKIKLESSSSNRGNTSGAANSTMTNANSSSTAATE